MSTASIFDVAYQGLLLVLWLSLPAVLTAALVGLGVAVLQATTQIQDAAIGQAVKLIAVIVVVAMTAKWMSTELYQFADKLFGSFNVTVSNPQ